MIVWPTLANWQAHRETLSDCSIGLVPTMGALHDGHRSLFERSVRECDLTVASLFVNPTQFDDDRDLSAYPCDPATDQDMLATIGVDHLIMPNVDEIYPDAYRYRVNETGLSGRFCGAHRPGHFDGVLTVVLKLLNLVQPDRAYFGLKDYQQMTLIADMVSALFLPVQVVPCEIIREVDGLAMSSRNVRLSHEQRDQASALPRILMQGLGLDEAHKQLEKAGFSVDYVDDFQGRRLAAVRIGDVRLIDNVPTPAQQEDLHERR